MAALIVADFDDPDVAALEARHGGAFTWLRLGLEPDSYDITITGDAAQLRSRDTCVSWETVDAADRVLMRRWRVSPPRPVVTAPDGRIGEVGQFMEREWSSAVSLLLWNWYQRSPEKWSRSPSFPTEKQHLLVSLCDLVQVPAFTISNVLPAPQHPTVHKPISLNQSFGDDGAHASTIRVDASDFASRQEVPSLLQDLVTPSRELRLTYCFGEIGVVAQTTESTVVDLRFAQQVDRWGETRPELVPIARAVARRLGLAAYTADIIVDRDETLWWVDINPDGLSWPCDADSQLIGALGRGMGLISDVGQSLRPDRIH